MSRELKYIEKAITYTDTTAVEVGTLPPGAYITDVKILVTTAFNSGGADVVDIGTSSSAAAFADDVDVSSTGAASVTSTAQWGVVQSTADQTAVQAIYVPAATAASAGAAKVVIEYAFNDA